MFELPQGKQATFLSLSSVLNRYRKRRVHNTANLLTGESDVAPGSIKVRRCGGMVVEWWKEEGTEVGRKGWREGWREG